MSEDKIRVTELPVGYWTEDFKELLESLAEGSVDKAGKKIAPIIKDYDDMSKDTTVDFIIYFQKGKLAELEASVGDNSCNGVHKLLKLVSNVSTTNMHLFDSSEKLKKYETVQSIIDDYYGTRLDLYQKRKDYLIDFLQRELTVLSNKARYIQEVLQDTIDLRKKTKDQVVKMLNDKKYDMLLDTENGYKYLTKMPMDSVTQENVDKLLKDKGDKEAQLLKIQTTTIQQMWLGELDILQKEYEAYKEDRERSTSSNIETIKIKVPKKK